MDLISRNFFPFYSGDPNAPYPGVSFEGVCNMHDKCYVSPIGDNDSLTYKLECDSSFKNDMESECEKYTSGPALTVCQSMASTYFSAVVNGGALLSMRRNRCLNVPFGTKKCRKAGVLNENTIICCGWSNTVTGFGLRVVRSG